LNQTKKVRTSELIYLYLLIGKLGTELLQHARKHASEEEGSVTISQHSAIKLRINFSFLLPAKELRAIAYWLSKSDHRATQRDHLSKRADKTGCQLLEQADFITWASGGDKGNVDKALRALWCDGDRE
jgi:hypothetical protein